MKIIEILSVFIPILLILWTLPGCKESAVEPDEPEIIPYIWKIVYEFSLNKVPDYSEIYIIEGDGSNLVKLTQNGGYDGQAVFSPDGSKIAFVSERDGNWEIYIMNTDGSGQVNLTNNPADDWNHVFSPDGSKIAFVSDRDGNTEIYIMNLDGNNQTNLTKSECSDLSPTFSPDGSRIAFGGAVDINKSAIYIMDIDGSNVYKVTQHDNGGILNLIFQP